jgi:hypothetical protein
MTKELTPKDWEKVELYLKAGAKPWNVAKAMHVSNSEFKKALEQRYGNNWEDVVESFDQVGTMLVQATQFQKALSGNTTMLIWLGKVRCGQREPDLVTSTPPAQDQNDKDHLIIQLQHQNTELQTQLTALTGQLIKNAD